MEKDPIRKGNLDANCPGELSNPGLYDILVVGGGPAGSQAAAAAARDGVATLLIDTKQRIGERPHCGEFVPQRLFLEHVIDRSCVVQQVGSMETRVLQSLIATVHSPPTSETIPDSRISHGIAGPGKPYCSPVKTAETASRGFIIDRVKLDRDLARVAAEAGATVMCGTRLTALENGSWIIKCGDTTAALKPKYVIAADGALSTVAKCLGLNHPEVLTGVQVEAPLAAPLDKTLVFLERSFTGGYGWLFPKGKVANVGIGVARHKGLAPRIILERLVGLLVDIGLTRPGRLARWGGVIPVSGPGESLVAGNVIFCGDSAGLTHPITGAGIPQAVLSGELAGRAAAAAVKTGKLKPLHDYESEIRGRYYAVLQHALAKRRDMMRQWYDDNFEVTCQNSWIAFKGYRKRSRTQ